jgi:hypothetical protein
LYSSPNTITSDKIDRKYSKNGVEEGFGGKGRMKETTRKTRRRWRVKIKMDLKGIRCIDCLEPAQGKDQWRVLVNTETNFWVL